eukprot:TRINITY_DN8444_c0_g1_i2.p1 TRINITY_DN8444_c0_g1~~TRINITY_DN8444_c0_g1_i2.p1  ORF type:complete len:562 (+),score=87.06 TRINITY_DN8444_c0_g1_i2:19-1704(+)
MAFRPDASSAVLPDMSVARSNPVSRENLFDRIRGRDNRQNAQYRLNARSAEMIATASLPSEHADVIVVGAGVSGLTAATTVHNSGLTVAVLEASGRIGGRTVTEHMKTAVGKHYVDLGGQWISPTSQPHATELIRRLDLQLFPQYCKGKHLLQVDTPKVQTYSGTIPYCLGLLANLNLGYMLWWIESYVSQINPLHPNEHPRAQQLDQQSLEQAILPRQWFGPILGLMQSAVRCSMGADPHQLSALFMMFYSRAAGSMNNLIETDGGAQECRVEGGMLQVSEKLVEALPKDSVHLYSPVIRIEKHHEDFHVIHGDGRLKTCRHVILALAPSQIAAIEFDPPLPAWRRDAYATLKMGHLIKVVLSYKTAFWRDKSLSGQFVSNQGPLCIVMDATNSSGTAPALVGFIGGDDAAKWTVKTPIERRDAVVKHLAQAFGLPAKQYIDYAERDWLREPYAGGCPVNLVPPGKMGTLSFDRLRESHGNIHFAGTEMATCWPGYINGAAQAGWVAAEKAVTAMGAKPKDVPTIDAVMQAETDPATYVFALAGVTLLAVGVVYSWKCMR